MGSRAIIRTNESASDASRCPAPARLAMSELERDQSEAANTSNASYTPPRRSSGARQPFQFKQLHYYSLGDRFVGREKSLAELDAWLSPEEHDISVRVLCALG